MKLLRCTLVVVAIAAVAVATGAAPASAAPAISSFSPTAAGNTGSTVLTVNGSGFVSGASVALVQTDLIGNVTYTINASTVNVQSATKLVAALPNAGEKPGAYKVRVTNPDHTPSTSSGTFSLIGDTPVIDAITPATANRGTSLTLTVTGSNLSKGAAWVFDDDGNALTANIAINTVTVDSPSQVRLAVTIPTGDGANPARKYDLTVTNADDKTDTCTDCFTTTNPGPAPAPPVPQEIAPTLATNSPSNTSFDITIEGSGFDSNPNQTQAQLVNGGFVVNVTNVVVTQGTLIQPDTLTGKANLSGQAPGAYDVVLRNPDDGGVGSLADAFTVAATGAPVVSSFQQVTVTQGGTAVGPQTPKATIPAGESRTFELNGDHFARGDVVSFGTDAVEALNPTWISKTKMRVTLEASPAAGTASMNLTVTHTDGQFGGCSSCVVVDGNDLQWLLTNRTSSPTIQRLFKLGVDVDVALVCDWDGNGTETPGLRRGDVWMLSNKVDGAGPYTTFAWGRATDDALCGDWDDNGTATPGLRRGSTFFLRNQNSTGPHSTSFSWGRATDWPVVGDWNGDGRSDIGLRRDDTFFLRTRFSRPHGTAFSWGRASDWPVVGDWNADGVDTVGLRRGSTWYLKNKNQAGPHSTSYPFGLSTDEPITGDFDGNGSTTVGVIRVV